MAKVRIDKLLVDKGLTPSRPLAKAVTHVAALHTLAR